MSDNKLLTHPLVQAEIERQVSHAVTEVTKGYISPTLEHFEIPVPPQAPKSPIDSKTIWFNAGVGLLISLISLVPDLEPLVSVETYAWLGFAAAVGNVLLRFVTQQAISLGASRG